MAGATIPIIPVGVPNTVVPFSPTASIAVHSASSVIGSFLVISASPSAAATAAIAIIIMPWGWASIIIVTRWWRAVAVSIPVQRSSIAVIIVPRRRPAIFVVAWWRAIIIVAGRSTTTTISSESVAGICGSSHVHARGGSVWTLGDAEVHSDLPPIQLKPVHRLPGIRSRLYGFKVDKGESSASAGVSI
jgi:hypothetical protein